MGFPPFLLLVTAVPLLVHHTESTEIMIGDNTFPNHYLIIRPMFKENTTFSRFVTVQRRHSFANPFDQYMVALDFPRLVQKNLGSLSGRKK